MAGAAAKASPGPGPAEKFEKSGKMLVFPNHADFAPQPWVPRDIATYVGQGTLDVGITGQDLMRDSGSDAVEVLQLGFAPSTFRLAAPKGTAGTPGDLAGRRIATSYPGILASWLMTLPIAAVLGAVIATVLRVFT